MSTWASPTASAIGSNKRSSQQEKASQKSDEVATAKEDMAEETAAVAVLIDGENMGYILLVALEEKHMGRRTISGRILTLIASSVVPLLLTIWIPMASVSVQQETSVRLHQALAAKTQGTPAVDSTVTALQKENLQHQNNWLWSNATPLLSTILSILAIVSTALFSLYRWRKDQRIEREKRADDQRIEREKRDEERFQAVVAGLGSKTVEARVGAAIMLRTFLGKSYERFYVQAFDLAVAHLRLHKADPNTLEPLDSLRQALIAVLKESFPLARKQFEAQTEPFEPELLDATWIQLDNAYLSQTDLERVYMRHASLRKAYFRRANLEKAILKHSNLTSAFLVGAHLEKADLGYTVLTGAEMRGAHLQGAYLTGARLDGADLKNADLTGAELTGTHPENAQSLKGTILRGVEGLNQVQLDACAAKGAIL